MMELVFVLGVHVNENVLAYIIFTVRIKSNQSKRILNNELKELIQLKLYFYISKFII